MKYQLIIGVIIQMSFPALTYFDIVNYLVYGSNLFFSIAQFKSYKSLEAYDRFVSGWVRKVESFSSTCDDDGKILKFIVIKVK